MRRIALLATASTIALVALPASAQMRTSAPKAAVKATVAPTTDSGVRPTHIAGAERAQVLTPGSLIWNFGGLGFQYGLMENLELDVNAGWNPGLTLAPAVGLTGGLNAGVGAKYLFLNSGNMSVGVNGGLGLNFLGGTATTTLDLGVPVSFWQGKSAYHVVPGLRTTAAGTSFGADLAYERELNSKWRLFAGDRLTITTAGAIQNRLEGGVRVAFTPNLTVDTSLVSGNLDINPFGLGANATLVNFGATFGTKSINELRGFFGI
jgi:hypothetical protein